MNDMYTRELRNIRITLIILTIIVAIVSGGSDNLEAGNDVYPQSSYSNMVDLGNGHFGVLSGRTESEDEETFKIYFYDIEKDELILKKETLLSEIQ